MSRLLYTILVNSVALFLVSELLADFSFEGGYIAPILAGAILTLLNFFVKPVLKFLSFPLVFMSAGLFLIVINALIVFLTEYIIAVMDIEGVTMQIENPLTYLIAAIIFGLANWLIHWILKD